MIIGKARYLALTGFNYVAHVVPPLTHPNITGRTSSHSTAILTAENEEDRRNFAIVTDFCKGMGDNICDALDSWYYNQLQHQVFKYRNVNPIQYLDHFKDQWVNLNEQVIKELTDYYLRGWKPDDKHITGFALRLDEEQAQLKINDITIPLEQKKNHYMIQM